MKSFFNTAAVFGFVAVAALPATAQTTSGTVEIFTEVGPGAVGPGGTAAEALNGLGNIELGETDGGLDGFQGGLTLDLGGGTLALRSLTQADWDGGLADQWFSDAWAAYGAELQPLLDPFGITQADVRVAFDTFEADARLSDPNIESVTELADGDVEIDLAGFAELNSLLDVAASIVGIPLPPTLPPLPDLFASEVVAYDYQGESGFLYSIGEAPAPSGVVSADSTNSFTGNYTVVLDAVDGPVGPEPPTPEPPTSVPEPAGMLGLAVVGSAMALRKRFSTT